jgi:histidinol-phosphate aminotransferase
VEFLQNIKIRFYMDRLIKKFFPGTLVEMDNRQLQKKVNEEVIQLDKNELPYEVNPEVKKQIIDKLKSINWNRYPSPYFPELEELIADYSGVNNSNIVLGIGAGQLINMLFNFFGNKKLIITHPSFSLFEFLCRAYDFNYLRWNLDKDLQYSASNFPAIAEEAVVVLASPNNPTGTIINKDLLRELLKDNPDKIFLLDEVYAEFSKVSHKDLLKYYPNLIIIRSFSKAFGLAGVRAGYLICAEPVALQLRKIVLPFVLNHFSEITLKTVLKNSDIRQDITNKIQKVTRERDRLYKELKAHEKNAGFTIYPSNSNFLLLKFQNKSRFKQYLAHLQEKNIQVLDLSSVEGLDHAMRITIGRPEENNKVIECVKKCS